MAPAAVELMQCTIARDIPNYLPIHKTYETSLRLHDTEA